MKALRVLIACEFSATVRDAFLDRGHDAYSCDFLPCESRRYLNPMRHYMGNVLDILDDGWDLLIAHPPCQFLAVSGARWFHLPERQVAQKKALAFVRKLMAAPIEKICIENPVSIISSRIRKPDQIIQPWMFGHGETKATCLWLKNLPALKPTKIVPGREARIHKMAPGPDRWKLRSKTYSGIAAAFAGQWG